MMKQRKRLLMNFRILLGGLLLLVSFHTLAGDAELNKELRLSAIVDDVESIENCWPRGRREQCQQVRQDGADDGR